MQQSMKNVGKKIYDVKNNPQNFCKYVKKKRKTNVSITQLYKLNTNKKVYCGADYDKAATLASQLNIVFTIEGENM